MRCGDLWLPFGLPRGCPLPSAVSQHFPHASLCTAHAANTAVAATCQPVLILTCLPQEGCPEHLEVLFLVPVSLCWHCWAHFPDKLTICSDYHIFPKLGNTSNTGIGSRMTYDLRAWSIVLVMLAGGHTIWKGQRCYWGLAPLQYHSLLA